MIEPSNTKIKLIEHLNFNRIDVKVDELFIFEMKYSNTRISDNDNIHVKIGNQFKKISECYNRSDNKQEINTYFYVYVDHKHEDKVNDIIKAISGLPTIK